MSSRVCGTGDDCTFKLQASSNEPLICTSGQWLTHGAPLYKTRHNRPCRQTETRLRTFIRATGARLPDLLFASRPLLLASLVGFRRVPYNGGSSAAPVLDAFQLWREQHRPVSVRTCLRGARLVGRPIVWGSIVEVMAAGQACARGYAVLAATGCDGGVSSRSSRLSETSSEWTVPAGRGGRCWVGRERGSPAVSPCRYRGSPPAILRAVTPCVGLINYL